MDVSQRVLRATDQYIRLRQQWRAADEMEEILEVTVKRMSPGEFQAYQHFTGVWDIANNVKREVLPEFSDGQQRLPFIEDGTPSIEMPAVMED